ncbi:MAG: ABC transporter ATP-binding protein [Candidatus Bathyarchaeia archaeon]
MQAALLECRNLTKKFGGLVALDDFNCIVKENEIVGLVGPNGSGKTTFLNLVVGVYPPSNGVILFRGEKITGLPPNKIIKLGIAKTNQIPKPFFNLTVLENVIMGGIFGSNMRKEDAEKNANELLEFVGLSHVKNEFPEKLTGVQLKLLELARALNARPKLLLLDEIAAGVSELEIKQIQSLIRRINEEWNVSIIWVEHIIEAVSETCDKLICLNEGRKIAEGEPHKVLRCDEVVKAYLGDWIC